MKKDTKEIGILKKITTYKKIIKYENDGLSHGDITTGLSSSIKLKLIFFSTLFIYHGQILQDFNIEYFDIRLHLRRI